jgi:hypothetical protein
MQRVVTLLGILATAGALAFLVLNVVANPIAARREQLVTQLAEVPALRVDVGPLATHVDIDAVQESISGKKSLWQELVPPPPPPPPPPEPAPDLAKMLEGVQPTRQRVGDAIRIITPENARGGRYAVGDSINGVTITEITPTAVLFEYVWKEKVLTHTLPRK